MESEVIKGKPLSKDETKALLDLIEGNHIITTRGTNATNNKLKAQEWIRIATRFNATTATTCRRTPQQLRLKWENLKKNSRKRSTKIRMNNLHTGGGPREYIPPDEILDRVASLLGNTLSGFIVSYGGDAEDIDENTVCDSCDGEPTLSQTVTDVRDNARVALEVLDLEGNPTVSPNKNLAATPSKPKKLAFAASTSGKKKGENAKTARNIAIAEYLKVKKKILEETQNNILLQNKKLELENEKLRLETEQLKKNISEK